MERRKPEKESWKAGAKSNALGKRKNIFTIGHIFIYHTELSIIDYFFVCWTCWYKLCLKKLAVLRMKRKFHLNEVYVPQ